jgi:hypothetical protein
MTKLPILLAIALAVAFAGQKAMGDQSLATDVQEMFGPTVSGAGPVTLIATISKSMSGLTEDFCAVTTLETIKRSELVRTVSILSSEETKWPLNPFDAQAKIEGGFR